jgi:hypothetical protein
MLVLRIVTIATAVVLAATPVVAQSQSSATAKPAAGPTGEIKAGVYDLEIAFGGGTMPGLLTVTQVNADSLTASLKVGDHEPPPVRKIVRRGSTLHLEAGGDGMSVIYDLQFTTDAVNGKFTFNGDPGLVSGKLKK